MHHHILVGLAVIGLGVVTYEKVLKPQLSESAETAAPYVQSAVDGAQAVKSAAGDAIAAAKNSDVGQKINDFLNNQQPFFAPTAPPPARPTP